MSTTTTIATIPVSTYNGSGVVPTQPVPVNLDDFYLTIQATSGNPSNPFQGFSPHPFSSASMIITFGVKWSWDGGATFPQSTECSQNGSPTGIWGNERSGAPIMVPDCGLGTPFDSTLGGRPNAYQGYYVITNGPITFGLTIQEIIG